MTSKLDSELRAVEAGTKLTASKDNVAENYDVTDENWTSVQLENPEGSLVSVEHPDSAGVSVGLTPTAPFGVDVEGSGPAAATQSTGLTERVRNAVKPFLERLCWSGRWGFLSYWSGQWSHGER